MALHIRGQGFDSRASGSDVVHSYYAPAREGNEVEGVAGEGEKSV